jgi:solute:Na+ symporter, SSS family
MTTLELNVLDYVAIVGFLICLSLVGYFAGRGETASSTDYFLAGKRLPWYVVGSSLVASVLSTEHLVGMVGWALLYGVSTGMWIWALVTDITLLVFLWVPFLLASRVVTIPQFLELRFDSRIRLTFATVTIILNIFSFMAAVLYAGGLALQQLFGWDIAWCIVALGLVSGVWAIYGGLSSVAWTDMLTVLVIGIGGIVVVWFGLNALAPGSIVDGLQVMLDRNAANDGVWSAAVEEHRTQFTGADDYNRLSVFQPNDHLASPTVGLLLSSLSVGIWYNVMNQFVIQRVLGARDAYHARIGLIFSGILFLALGFVIILPGLIIFALRPEILLQDWSAVQVAADRAYIELIHELLPIGLRGLVVAALFGAVQSTVNSVLNSTATIFAFDIYRGRLRPGSSDRSLVHVGVMTSIVTLTLAIGIAIVVSRLEMSIFYYMQLLNAFFAAPFAAAFMLGVLWRRMNTTGAIAALSVGFASAVVLKFAPDFIDSFPRWATTFLNQAALVLLISGLAGVIGSLCSRPPRPDQISDQLTFRWSNPLLRIGYERGPIGRVLIWWLGYLLITAAVFIYFSPMTFN